tara:strand:+ start:385 stop:732 length:348 start_codon:yes stop_codon:yes gene_type:complete
MGFLSSIGKVFAKGRSSGAKIYKGAKGLGTKLYKGVKDMWAKFKNLFSGGKKAKPTTAAPPSVSRSGVPNLTSAAGQLQARVAKAPKGMPQGLHNLQQAGKRPFRASGGQLQHIM